MKIFNSIHNHEVSCYLEILYHASASKEPVSEPELRQIIQKYPLMGFDSMKRILKFLQDSGILCEASEKGHYQLAEDNLKPVRPILTSPEIDYLHYILEHPLSTLFLTESLRSKLLTLCRGKTSRILNPEYIIDLRSKYSLDMPMPPEDFRTIVKAIEQNRRIRYRYTTKDSSDETQAECVPYRLEYSDTDGRWWLLLYDELQQRSIKAILSNLQQIELGSRHSLSDAAFQESLQRLKSEQKLVLRVNDQKNALLRCFSLFEQQDRLSVKKVAEGEYLLEMTYYAFDNKEILKKLLFLGDQVILEAPENLRQEYLQNLKSILKNHGG